jgi:hypothetical protein
MSIVGCIRLCEVPPVLFDVTLAVSDPELTVTPAAPPVLAGFRIAFPPAAKKSVTVDDRTFVVDPLIVPAAIPVEVRPVGISDNDSVCPDSPPAPPSVRRTVVRALFVSRDESLPPMSSRPAKVRPRKSGRAIVLLAAQSAAALSPAAAGNEPNWHLNGPQEVGIAPEHQRSHAPLRSRSCRSDGAAIHSDPAGHESPLYMLL